MASSTIAKNTKMTCGVHSTVGGATTKTITGKNGYQQYIITMLSGSFRTLTMLTCMDYLTTVYEDKVFTTDNTKSFNATYSSSGTFTIDLPANAQYNIISTEDFTVS